jgi:adenylate cyclase class 2
MPIEIEAKLKVDSHEPVIEKLKAANAKFLSEQLQTEQYFDTPEKTLTNADKCLRLRRITKADAKQIILTYKGPKQKDDFKKRAELELELADLDTATKLLVALGYEKALIYEKKRTIWMLDDCEIALDQLPMLGNFVEIEGPNAEKITDVQKTLGLENSKHIMQSYAHLMQKELSKQRQTP